ncbi:nucleic acid/nucleotide deaminase domain-containing protein [Streptomyces sp. BH106]|uniref:nucleic acid/nucleotide deaminase domain-containing protein n=1 Tax=Streptomyces sp. BH106 TaxID=3410409 RepID=UPI003CEBFEAA
MFDQQTYERGKLMGITLPGWADEALDIIGVSWPNVDEDDYREMAAAMREFADAVDSGAMDAHQLLNDLIGNSEGAAVEALSAHWSKVMGTHLANLGEAGRLTGTALDAVAVLIEGAKIAAIVQLGILAAEIASAAAAAPFTLGLSTLGGLAGTVATRTAVKRIFKEVCEQIAEQIVNTAMGPVYEALGSMVGDLAIQAAGNAMGTQKGISASQTANAGKDSFNAGVDSAKQSGSMQLLSAEGSSGGGASGGSGGGSGKFSIDLDAFDSAGSKLKNIGADLGSSNDRKLGRARNAHGRTRGKDALADAANAGLDTVMDGIQKGAKRLASHLDDTMPRGLKRMATNHRENDKNVALSLDELGKRGDKTPMYLMSDNGSIQRLHSSGKTSELTQDDHARLGLDSASIGRPKPGERNASLKTKAEGKTDPRQRSDSQQVALGSTDLSRATQLARHAGKSYGGHKKNGDFQSNNYAAARVSGSDGAGDFVLVARSNGFRHSERMIGTPFLRQGDGDRISEMYTERAPCATGANCSSWIAERFPNTNVSHSVEYGATKESRAAGNAAMENYLDQLRSKR